MLGPILKVSQPLSRKLPLMFTALVGAVLLASVWLMHSMIERTALSVSTERLTTSAERLASVLHGSAENLRRDVAKAASDSAVVGYLEHPTTVGQDAVQAALRPGAAVIEPLVRELWSRNCVRVLSIGRASAATRAIPCPRFRAPTAGKAEVSELGERDGMMVYSITAPVIDARGDTLGFVRELKNLGPPTNARALAALIGPRTTLLLGNARHRFWTDMERRVPGPSAEVRRNAPTAYTEQNGTRVVGVAFEVASTPWLVWVQMPYDEAVAAAQRLLLETTLAALLCLALCALGAYVVSRQVTRPLAEITEAARALAAGDYERRVAVGRADELGQLADSFNQMAARIQADSSALEQKARELEVQYRQAQELTTELEATNVELQGALAEAMKARRETAATQSLLDDVLTSAPVGIAVFDRELRFVRLNAAMAALSGLPIEAHLGLRPTEVDPHLDPSIEHRLQLVIETGEPTANDRVLLGMSRRVPRTALVSSFPVRGDDGQVAGVATIVMDTTALEDLESQLRQAQKMEAIGRLAGGVAHDFNNLLTVITTCSEFIMEVVPRDGPARRDAEEIQNAATRAAGLTRQLLAFGRKQMLQPQVVSMNAIALEMQHMLRRLLAEDIELELSLGGDVGEVHADPGQLEQVIMNLAVNARDAMPNGGCLRIETASATFSRELSLGALGAAAGEYVTLTVSDTGTGMPPEVQARLFEPFFSTKAPGLGTGLGLSTVYGIVKQSGGDISVRSAPGEGSSFTIYIPQYHGEPADDGRRAAEAQLGLGGPETILLLEDDDVLRRLAVRVLSRQGYRVLEARAGAEALRLSAEHDGPIELLLTDVVMPGMNGREVGERLGTQRRDMRILYMSGYTDDEVTRRGIRQERVEFIGKPFSAAQLLAKVRSVLDMATGSPLGVAASSRSSMPGARPSSPPEPRGRSRSG